MEEEFRNQFEKKVKLLIARKTSSHILPEVVVTSSKKQKGLYPVKHKFKGFDKWVSPKKAGNMTVMPGDSEMVFFAPIAAGAGIAASPAISSTLGSAVSGINTAGDALAATAAGQRLTSGLNFAANAIGKSKAWPWINTWLSSLFAAHGADKIRRGDIHNAGDVVETGLDLLPLSQLARPVVNTVSRVGNAVERGAEKASTLFNSPLTGRWTQIGSKEYRLNPNSLGASGIPLESRKIKDYSVDIDVNKLRGIFEDYEKSLTQYKGSTLPNIPKYNYKIKMPKIDFNDLFKDDFVDYLSQQIGKVVKRVPIKNTKHGEIYNEGFAFVDDEGKEVAHIAGRRKAGKNVFVESSYVAPEYRYRGLGKQMYFDLNEHVFDSYGTTLHSDPMQRVGSTGIGMSPSNRLWKSLREKGVSSLEGEGFNRYDIMVEPSKITTAYRTPAIPTVTSENAASITPAQWTAAQDAAIARGDMTEAQRLRDLHFKVSAPNSAAVGEDGFPLSLFHGTRTAKGIRKNGFSKAMSGKGNRGANEGNTYLTNSYENAEYTGVKAHEIEPIINKVTSVYDLFDSEIIPSTKQIYSQINNLDRQSSEINKQLYNLHTGTVWDKILTRLGLNNSPSNRVKKIQSIIDSNNRKIDELDRRARIVDFLNRGLSFIGGNRDQTVVNTLNFIKEPVNPASSYRQIAADRVINAMYGTTDQIYSPEVLRLYGNFESPLLSDFKMSPTDINPLKTGKWSPTFIDYNNREKALLQELAAPQYDSSISKNKFDVLFGDVYIAKKPNSLKLADAVTYDDKGVRIPLGERDNFKLNDIRYNWIAPFVGLGTLGTLLNKKRRKNMEEE